MRLVYEHLTAIPANFTEVEYLESSGTQYIDTDVIPSEDVSYGWEIYAQAVDTGENDYHWFIGTQTPWQMAGTYPDRLQYTFYPGGGNYYQGGSKVSIPAGGNKYGIVQHTNSFTGSSSNSTSITLFARRASSGGVSTAGSKKIFCCKMSKNNVLIRDFVPCLDNNNVPCMYDKVGGKAYYNAGTGSFTYGRKIIPVEYLEGTGTQWLKTDYTLTANTKIDVLFSPNQQTTANLWVIGSYVASNKLTGVRITGETTIDCYINKVVSKTVSGSNIGNRYQAVLDGKWTVNGSEGTAVTVSAGLSPLTLFGWNASTTANTYSILGICSAKIYHCNIWDNGTLARDFISCKDENNVGFMFDRVTHTAYLNVGTGSFITGSVKPKKKLRLIRESKRKFPKGFKEVEYLESIGTQYIDTGYSFNSSTDEIELYYQNTSTLANKWLFGSYESNANIGISSANLSQVTFWYNGNVWGAVSSQYDKKHILRYDSTGMSNDGVNLKAFTSYAGTWNLYLFALNNTGTSPNGYYGYGKVWRYTHKRNGVLIRDYIPCLDASNVPCMYDLVEGKAYYNAGTGSFTYGHTITPVEYLQSSGTQYIDTGITGGSTTKAEIKCFSNNTTSNKALFGARDSSTFYNSFTIWQTANSKIRFDYSGNTSNVKSTIAWDPTVPHILKKDGRYNYIDEVQQTSNDGNTFSCNYTFSLFGVNTGGTTAGSTCLVGRVYYCRIWNGSGTLVRDYIPVKDENNVGYMFDKVTHSLYANAGTGDFVIGNEIKQDITRFVKDDVPNIYRKVSYLESSGTQYIDTGWTPISNDLRVNFKAKSMGSPYTKAICGAEKTGVVPRWVFIMYGQSADRTKSFPLTGNWNNNDSGFTFTSGSVLDIDWVTSTSETTITDKISNTTYTYNFGTNITYSNNDVTLKLFENTDSQKSSIQLNYYKIWDNSILKRDFVPVVRKSDNKPGMYDRVTKQFFTNAGTGEFIIPT